MCTAMRAHHSLTQPIADIATDAVAEAGSESADTLEAGAQPQPSTDVSHLLATLSTAIGDSAAGNKDGKLPEKIASWLEDNSFDVAFDDIPKEHVAHIKAANNLKKLAKRDELFDPSFFVPGASLPELAKACMGKIYLATKTVIPERIFIVACNIYGMCDHIKSSSTGQDDLTLSSLLAPFLTPGTAITDLAKARRKRRD